MAQIKTKRISRISEKCMAPAGYIPVNVMSWHSKDTPHYEFSPYFLKTDGKEEQTNLGGVLFENFWQGSKVYPKVFSNKVYSHWNNRDRPDQLWWEYSTKNPRGDVHYSEETDTVLEEYFSWRESIWSCRKPIRYPNGWKNRRSVVFSLLNKAGVEGVGCTNERLGYIEARKRIYLSEYTRLIRGLEQYQKLVTKLGDGEKICIFEIDVPRHGKRGYFGSNINDDGTYDVTTERLEILLNDPSEAFGHGLCLASALLGDGGLK